MKNTLFLSRSKKLFVLVFLFLHCFAFNKASAQNDEFKIEVEITPALLNKPINYFTLGLKLPFNIPVNGTIIGTIDWDDEQPNTNIPFNLPSPSVNMFSHTYTQDGFHTISISFPQMSIFVLNEHMSVASRLKRVVQWGNVPNLEYACFKNANQLFDVPATLPPSITSCFRMFTGCTALNDQDIAGWDVSNVRNFESMFGACTAFDVNLANWTFHNDLKVMGGKTKLNTFLNGATAFNQDLSTWCFPFAKPSGFSNGTMINANQAKQPKWDGKCCPAPNNINVVPGNNNAQLTWDNPSPLLNSTEVYIKVKDADPKEWKKVVVNQNNHNFNDLAPGTTYQYRLKAICNLPGKTSDEVQGEFNTLNPNASLPSCSAPSSLLATINSPACVTITWQPVIDVVSYFVQVKPSYIPTWDTLGILLYGATVTADRTYKTFDYFTPGTTYNYRVRGTCSYILPNPGGNFSTGFSSEGTFTLPNSIGMPVFFEENTTEWKMYPNPATDLVNINFHLEADSEITFLVYDLTGRIVQQVRLDGFVGANEMQMNIDNLNTGVYLVKAIYGNTNRVVGRVVKQ